MSARSVFEKVLIPGPGAEQLDGILMNPLHTPARRLVYIVPLMGSGAAQQILRFKSFAKRGSAILSFQYRGHGDSSGSFSVKKSLEDAMAVLRWAEAYATARRIPLHVHATCYGHLAMLSWYRDGRHSRSISSLSAVSGLLELDDVVKAQDFLGHYALCRGESLLTADAFIARMEQGMIDLAGDAYRNALRDYLQGLFPDLTITRDSFEELQYDRVDMPDLVREFFRLRPLAGVRVPDHMPYLLFFGRSDHLLGLDRPEGRNAYITRIRALVPHAQIREMSVDHFGQGGDRETILRQLADFFEAHDADIALASSPAAIPA